MRRRRYNYYGSPSVDTTELKSKLSEAFKVLRKEGFIARQNFMCCQNCAGYAIATTVGEMPEAKRAKFKGTVFYHHQDNDRLKETGELYLAYGNVDTTKCGEVGLPTVEVGKRVVEVLKEKGLTVEWDGSPDTRIHVKS